MLDHAVGIDAEAGLAIGCGLEVREDVHAGGVPPDEERLAVLVRLVDEVQRALGDFLVHRFHALPYERAGIFALLLAPLAKPHIYGGIVLIRRETVEYAARTEHRLDSRIFRIVAVLRLFLRVQVVKVAEELVEAVNRRDKLIAVAEVVFAELAGNVTESLEQLPEGHLLLLQTLCCALKAHLRDACAHPPLPAVDTPP